MEITAILERIAPRVESRRETGTGGDRALVERDRLVDALRVLHLPTEIDERLRELGIGCDRALEGARRAHLVPLLPQHEAQVVPRRRVARLALDGLHEIRLGGGEVAAVDLEEREVVARRGRSRIDRERRIERRARLDALAKLAPRIAQADVTPRARARRRRLPARTSPPPARASASAATRCRGGRGRDTNADRLRGRAPAAFRLPRGGARARR
jgi:hypothetical protein